MGRRIWRITVGVVIAAVLFLPRLIVEACGPDLSGPSFTYFNLPDVPVEDYAHGKLGLLEPGFYHAYLFVAYRNLIGKPLDDTEIAALKPIVESPTYGNLWNESSTNTTRSSSPTNWMEQWLKARARVVGNPLASSPRHGVVSVEPLQVSNPLPGYYYDPTGISRNEQVHGEYIYYYNCLAGAFQNAFQVLGGLVMQFGAESPYVKQWVAAQDEVFDNCAPSLGYPPRQPPAVIPATAPATDPQLIREDRAYQIASAHFYTGDFDQAREDFAAIAKDPASPYREIAPYLVARCLVREGTLNAGINKVNAAALEQAQHQLKQILVDSDLAKYHHAARGLLQFINIRLHPRERAQELELALISGKPNPEFYQHLTDYLWLLDHEYSAEPPSSDPPVGVSQRPVQHLDRGGMTEWIETFSNPTPASFQHSLHLWRNTHGLPWLVAAISQADGSDAASASLIAVAQKIPVNSPAYITVTFHRLRLLAESGQTAAARSGLDEVLQSPSLTLTRGARNEFLALRMTISRSFNDWLHYALRSPVDMGGFEYVPKAQMSKGYVGMFFDSDASITLSEKLPLPLLAEAAKSTGLPANLRKEIALATWNRAILLRDAAVANRVTPLLASLAPELRKWLAAYAAAKPGPEKNFVAVFLLLHFPGMRPFVPAGVPRGSLFGGPEQLAQIDDFRDNWWCRMGSSGTMGTWSGYNYYTMYAGLSQPLREIYPSGVVPDPSFMTASERSAAEKEWAALKQLPTAPDWLGKETLAWARAHPNDPRMPEALHLVVRVTRFGCVDADTRSYSKQAFTLLHSRYPRSPWARKTPYWFN